MRMPTGTTVGAEADDEIERGELDDRSAEALEFVEGDGELVVGEKDDEDAGDAEDGARGSGADGDVIACPEDVEAEAEQVAGDAGEHVDGDQSQRAEERLAEEAEVPEAPHVGGEMDDADVDEGGGEQAVPLRRGGRRPGTLAPKWTSWSGVGELGGDSVEEHPEKDGAVDGDEGVGARSAEEASATVAGAGLLLGVVGHGTRGRFGVLRR